MITVLVLVMKNNRVTQSYVFSGEIEHDVYELAGLKYEELQERFGDDWSELDWYDNNWVENEEGVSIGMITPGRCETFKEHQNVCPYCRSKTLIPEGSSIEGRQAHACFDCSLRWIELEKQ